MKNIKVLRKQVTETKKLMVGDQISVKLKGFGKFTATVQKITDEGVLFMFDEAIARHYMNESSTNEGGFDKSDMKKWLDNVVLKAFPKKLRNAVSCITLPTYGEIFGHDDFYENFEPDNDEQFTLMKERRNRVAYLHNDWCWWWLRNTTKKEVSSAVFARVGGNGSADCYDATDSGGVRPEFWLVR